MNDPKIEKMVRKVSLLLSDNTHLEGEVFLSLYDLTHSGSQNLGDLLNGGEQFIPLKTEKGIVLLNMKHIVQAKIASEREADDMMKTGSSYTIWVKTEIGGLMEGDIFISLRDGRFGRVKDYVNQPLTFFRLFQPEYVVYLNQRFILSIHDQIAP